MSWSECCGCAMAFYAACQRHMMVQYCCGSAAPDADGDDGDAAGGFIDIPECYLIELYCIGI